MQKEPFHIEYKHVTPNTLQAYSEHVASMLRTRCGHASYTLRTQAAYIASKTTIPHTTTSKGKQDLSENEKQNH